MQLSEWPLWCAQGVQLSKSAEADHSRHLLLLSCSQTLPLLQAVSCPSGASNCTCACKAVYVRSCSLFQWWLESEHCTTHLRQRWYCCSTVRDNAGQVALWTPRLLHSVVRPSRKGSQLCPPVPVCLEMVPLLRRCIKALTFHTNAASYASCPGLVPSTSVLSCS